MLILDGEEQEIFLDSFEYLSTASDSASVADLSVSKISEREFIMSDYEVWIDDLRSIRERRSKFLRRMHFADMEQESPEIERMRRFERDLTDEFRSPDLDPFSREDRREKFLPIDLAENIEPLRLIVWEKMDFAVRFPQKLQETKKKKNKTPRSWWSCFSATGKTLGELFKCKPVRSRSKLETRCKRQKKCSTMSMVQEILAHRGSIKALKFSPDGRYLATGGEDCVVKIWRAVEEEEDLQFLEISRNLKLEETPVHELPGHMGGVLDLSWSESNYLLSSSMDKTVRLWRVGDNHCLQVFQHNDYVTCVEFNPTDESQFISGSIDGKVRIWGIAEVRVVDWLHFGDIITAVRYRPDGQGFVVGSLSGRCRLYSSSESIQLEKEVRLRGRKKPPGKSISGIQFFPRNSEKIMITSSDGKLRIYDGVAEIINKCRVPGRQKHQVSSSITSDGRFVVSVREDSSVCVWDHVISNKEKSTLTSQFFFSEAASLAATWPGTSPKKVISNRARPASVRETERFSLGAWFFFSDVHARASATWPEENLSICKDHLIRDIVTAGHDGVIRSFRSSGRLDLILLRPRDSEG